MSVPSAIPEKANRVLYLFLLALLLFLVRIIFLVTSGYEEHAHFAKHSSHRTSVSSPQRGAILDRFGKPLAVNRIEYSAAICYQDLKVIPRVKWEGKEKRFARRAYIESLCTMLGEELALDPQEIEDIIYSKASIFPNTPFILKSGLDEELYYKLRMLERKWPGLLMQRGSFRHYPNGDLAADVIGYMGAINDREYLAVAKELQELSSFLQAREEGTPLPLPKGFNSASELSRRYFNLKERSYTINDVVGKSGIEAMFDEELRGKVGHNHFEVGMQGSLFRKLPNSQSAVPGNTLQLTLSIELQKYAEELLLKSEKERDVGFASAGEHHDKVASPWIKGGAIVAMIPQTGEVVALATSPRFNPNDFILSGQNRQDNIRKWLETERFIGEIWEGRRPLEREFDSKPLTWERFLDMTLSLRGSVRASVLKVKSVGMAVSLLRNASILLEESALPSMKEFLSSSHTFTDPFCAKLYQEILRSITPIESNEDKLLFFDLLSLLINEPAFSSDALKEYGAMPLGEFFALTQTKLCQRAEQKQEARESFHTGPFATWRQNHFADYLREKRQEEKEKGRYQKPYLDYLQQAEEEQFKLFWSKRPRDAIFREFCELSKPLLGRYPNVRSVKGKQYQKHLASAFYPAGGAGFSRSFAYRQSAPLGSIFKVMTGLQALIEREQDGYVDLNPLTIIDEGSPKGPLLPTSILGYTLSGKPICRRYHGGTLPRSHAPLGKTNFNLAMQRSSNIYFSLLCTDVIKSPTSLLHTANAFGFGSKTGIALPYEYKGHLPNDLRDNKSGLYSFAIGQHSLAVTPLQTASMFATIANGGTIFTPQIVAKTVGTRADADPLSQKEYLFKKYLDQVGISFPLFTESSEHLQTREEFSHPPCITQTFPIAPRVRAYLLNSLDNVMWSVDGAASPYRIRSLYTTPGWYRDYVDLKHQMVGKTSTAERGYNPTLDREMPPFLCKDIWFGGVSFEQGLSRWEKPELVVVVFLRFGDYGKEAAPLAAQIVKKWREIKTNNCLH